MSEEASTIELTPELEEVAPSERLEELIERSDTPWEHHDRFCELEHLRLSLVHRSHDEGFGAVGSREVFLREIAGHDAHHISASFQHSLGDDSHQARVRGSVHEAVAVVGERFAEPTSCIGVGSFPAAASAAVDADELASVHVG